MAAQREWFEKDYYKVLGVADNAAAKDITKAYRKLARELHPDANPGNAAAEERFKEVSAAYDVLGDETKRKEYDEVRRLGPMAGGFGGPGGFGGGPGNFTFNMGTDGLGDLLGGLFGNRGRRGPGGGMRGAGPQRGEDLTATVTLEFADAVHGIATSLYLTSDTGCGTCDGSGAAPGTAPKVCGNCGGRGVTADNQGMFSFSAPCTVCAGRGVTVDTPCPTCRGTGIERRPREVKVRIPAGVADGQTIRLKERGAPGRNGGPSGDLLVECHVAPHTRFGRDGHNLTVRVPVTFPEAALGADIEVPTLEGTTVTLRLRAGTPSGSKHRVKGRGVVTSRHTGDLIVTTDVVVPKSLTDAQRDALAAFVAADPDNPRAPVSGSAPQG